jgi:hypothetical protein
MMRRVTLRRQGTAGDNQRASAKPSHCELRVLQAETHLCLDAPPNQTMALLRLAGASGGIGVRFTKAVNGPCKIVHIAPGVRIYARKCKPHQPGHGVRLWTSGRKERKKTAGWLLFDASRGHPTCTGPGVAVSNKPERLYSRAQRPHSPQHERARCRERDIGANVLCAHALQCRTTNVACT